MSLAAFARRYPLCTALCAFTLGCGATLAALRVFGTPWNCERILERVIEVETIVETPTRLGKQSRSVDLVVIQRGKPLGIESDFSEYFVEETRKMPEVERVSESVIGIGNILRSNGAVNDTTFLMQGWKPDNSGYDGIEVIAGRKLLEGDTHKVMLGRLLANSLNKNVGDKLTFAADPDYSYEVIAIFSSRVIFEENGAIVPYADGQGLHGLKGRVTGFTVKVKSETPDRKAEVNAVRAKIEALRDPSDPAVRLTAEMPD